MNHGTYSAACSLDSVWKYAEAAVEGHAHAALKVGVGGDARVEQRVEVLAVVLEAKEERLVVDAGGEERDLVVGHVDQLRRGRRS